jgi:hypothetical protein
VMQYYDDDDDDCIIYSVNVYMSMFCVVTPRGLVRRYRRFGGTHSFHFRGNMLSYETLVDYVPTSSHGVTTLKTNMDVLTAVKTSNSFAVY